ncbi:MAG: NAD(P)/FAD-dependent oxidoreductase [Candidatus Aenigmarchaeota archaeon]|nr:NAD(P)/FAD-dependent oxidoreductase [Candidatus Aenigmarchaeota archaeon]
MSEYDVIIVGAGPAGLSTGISTLYTNKDANVLIVDSRQEVGEEKCAEGLSKDWFDHMSKYGKYLLSRLEPKCFENEIYGVLLVLPSRKEIKIRTKKKHGWVLNKDFFLKNLAKIFEKRGGEIQLNTSIIRPVIKGKVVYGVETNEGNMIKGRCVIDATGINQTIWKKALNITEPLDKKNIEICCQYKVVDCDISDDDLLQIYSSENIAPGGYGWVFPKRGNKANVGIGCQGSRVMSAVPYQEKFWEMLKLNGKIVSKKGGTVDTCNLPESFVWSNLACVGSSARFTNPVHGGGTGPGLFGGYILGKNIGNAFIHRMPVEDALVDYQREIKSIRGKAHEYHYRVKNLLQACSDEELEMIFSSILTDEWMKSMSFTRREILKVIGRISKKSLRLGLKVMKYLGLG